MNRRILFCWELGGGSGHLKCFGVIARSAAERGYDVTFATRNIQTTRRYHGTSELSLVQAPVMWFPTSSTPSVSYPDMLLKLGYGSTIDLCSTLDAWLRLFYIEKPDFIVVEHSPTAIIAARIVDIPVAIQGSGFSVPPAQYPMPGLFSDGQTEDEKLLEIETRAIGAINRALKKYEVSEINSIADLFPVERCFLCTYSEFDHYGQRDNVKYYGTPEEDRFGNAPSWPDGNGEKVFVYMHPGYPQFPTMLSQLVSLQYPTLIVAPGINPDILNEWKHSNIILQTEHVDLDAVVSECRIVVCHAAHGTVARVLRHRVAPVVTPNFVEQIVFASQLARRRLAFAAHPDPSRHNYRSMIEACVDKSSVEHLNASAFSDRYLGDVSNRMSQMVRDIWNLSDF